MIDLHNSGILTEAEGVAKIKVVQVLFSLVHFILNRKTNFSESLQIFNKWRGNCYCLYIAVYHHHHRRRRRVVRVDRSADPCMIPGDLGSPQRK